MTDGTYTFVKFNYPEDGINWAYPGKVRFMDNFYHVVNTIQDSLVTLKAHGGWKGFV